jgi:hypothetical protein
MGKNNYRFFFFFFTHCTFQILKNICLHSSVSFMSFFLAFLEKTNSCRANCFSARFLKIHRKLEKFGNFINFLVLDFINFNNWEFSNPTSFMVKTQEYRIWSNPASPVYRVGIKIFVKIKFDMLWKKKKKIHLNSLWCVKYWHFNLFVIYIFFGKQLNFLRKLFCRKNTLNSKISEWTLYNVVLYFFNENKWMYRIEYSKKWQTRAGRMKNCEKRCERNSELFVRCDDERFMDVQMSMSHRQQSLIFQGNFCLTLALL